MREQRRSMTLPLLTAAAASATTFEFGAAHLANALHVQPGCLFAPVYGAGLYLAIPATVALVDLLESKEAIQQQARRLRIRKMTNADDAAYWAFRGITTIVASTLAVAAFNQSLVSEAVAGLGVAGVLLAGSLKRRNALRTL